MKLPGSCDSGDKSDIFTIIQDNTNSTCSVERFRPAGKTTMHGVIICMQNNLIVAAW